MELEDWQEDMRTQAQEMEQRLYPIWGWRARQRFVSAALDLTDAAAEARKRRDERKPDFAKDSDDEDRQPTDTEPEQIRVTKSYEGRHEW
jgi:hypothetical protein